MWANEPEMAEKWANENEEDEIEEGVVRITKRQLRRIIKEAQEVINELRTVPSRWWEYDPKDVMADLYHQQGQIPPPAGERWERQWRNIEKQLEKKYPRK